MPFYNLTEKLQVAGRCTSVDSGDANGVLLNRYEDRVVAGAGDAYHGFYLGLNYYLRGHKLKLQSGVLHARMRDRAGDRGACEGWSWTTRLRLPW